MKTKIMTILTIILFIGLFLLPNITSISTNEIDSLDEGSCYGFVVPIVRLENKSLGNDINCRIHHMINDILREKISVYWTSKNFTASILNINGSAKEIKYFEKGTFIIPFVKNYTINKKIISIACDYDQTSEIEENNVLKVPLYLIEKQININIYELVEVKIGQYRDSSTSCESTYIQNAEKYGFLNFKFLDTKNISRELDYLKYNVIMVPGASSSAFFREAVINTIYEDLRYGTSNAIRKFIANGGGYIGSCYGAGRAASAVLPVPVFFIRRAYNPDLKSFGVLAISDVIASMNVLSHWLMLSPMGFIEMRITNTSNPVSYNLNKVLIDRHLGGPKFVYLGKNSEKIAVFQNTNSNWDETPIWLSSKFGKGKVVLFSSHPEMIDKDTNPGILDKNRPEKVYYGKRIISNSLYYTTFIEKKDVKINNSENISFVHKIFNKTNNLSINSNESFDELSELHNKINKTKKTINNLSCRLNNIKDIVYDILKDNGIEAEETIISHLGYYEIKFMIYYLDLYNKYFEKISDILDCIKNVSSLFKDNKCFLENLNMLKNDIFKNINRTRNMFNSLDKNTDYYENEILKCQNMRKLYRLVDEKIHKMAVTLKSEYSKGFFYIPQIKFESLKFLRHYWYDYETSIIV